MNSIRIRLFAVLLVATGIVWLSAFLWIQASTRAEIERVLDARLAEAAQMVSSLISDQRIDVARAAAMVSDRLREAPDYSRKLSCQIWSLDGALVGRSGSAPVDRLSEQDAGFSTNTADGEDWRVFSIVNQALGMRVMVGDSLTVRNGLVRDVTIGLILPALLILPLLAGLIWLSVQQGLRPLDQLAKGLARRTADDLNPVSVQDMAREIRPVGTALNGLFSRVGAARDREKTFTAFAAHELKTPLAGIKTQAQVAMMAPDAATRLRALQRIDVGVERTDRMVRQLLALATVDSAEAGRYSRVEILDLLREATADQFGRAAAKGVTLVLPQGKVLPLESDPMLLAVALRNVIENAIAAAPSGSAVEVTFERTADHLDICVLDRGPGIAAQDRARVTTQFFRGTGALAGGSGLGLAVVDTAVARLGGQLTFAPREGGGEVVRLRFPVGQNLR